MRWPAEQATASLVRMRGNFPDFFQFSGKGCKNWGCQKAGEFRECLLLPKVRRNFSHLRTVLQFRQQTGQIFISRCEKGKGQNIQTCKWQARRVDTLRDGTIHERGNLNVFLFKIRQRDQWTLRIFSAGVVQTRNFSPRVQDLHDNWGSKIEKYFSQEAFLPLLAF